MTDTSASVVSGVVSQRSMGHSRIGVINARGIWSLFQFEMRRIYYYVWSSIAIPITTNLLFMLVFSWMMPGDRIIGGEIAYLHFLAAGLIVLGSLQAASESGSWSIMEGKMEGTLIHILMTPLGPLEFLFGIICAAVARGMIIGTIMFAILSMMIPLHIEHPLALLYFCVAGFTMGACLCMMVAIWAKNWDQDSAFHTFFISPAIYLGGPFFSLKNFGETWVDFAFLNPFAWIIDGMRYGLTGYAEGNLIVNAGLLFVASAGAFACLHAMLRSGYKLRL